MSKNENTRIPDSLLDQISEWSCGGFMLFNFDEEGNPQVYSKVESEKNAMSLQYLVNHWTQAMESMNSDAFINNMTGSFSEDSGEGYEEEGYEEEGYEDE
jgi:hypothetical protein